MSITRVAYSSAMLCCCLALILQTFGSHAHSRPLGEYSLAAVVSGAEECSQIGRDLLLRNGSAVDAAIGVLLCLGVVNSQSSGLGGGFVMSLYDDVTQEAASLVARETAPASASHSIYKNASADIKYGWLAVAVPGELAGYSEAHKRYGRLAWSELFQPSITLCQNGYRMNKHQADYLSKFWHQLKLDTTYLKVFGDESGNPLPENSLIKRPLLAKTLKRIASFGADTFYNGSLGKQIVDEIQKNGGILTMNDFNSYKARWVSPLHTRISVPVYLGKPHHTDSFVTEKFTLYTLPPPASGVLLNMFFNIMDNFNYTSKILTASSQQQALFIHRIVETMKFIYAYRTKLGDPKFVNISNIVEQMNDASFAEQITQRIVDELATRTFTDVSQYGAQAHASEQGGTSHVTVVTSSGGHRFAVSVTSTINLHFGSKRTAQGISLNNEMDDFSLPGRANYFNLPAAPANYIHPGKMMQSSMSPAIFVDSSGKLRLVLGAAGGSRIPSSIALVAFRHLYLNRTIKEATDNARFHHQLIPDILQMERNFPQSILDDLRRYKHKIRLHERLSSAVHSISVMSDESSPIKAYVDPRKLSGATAGF